jgi:hypothetical protein
VKGRFVPQETAPRHDGGVDYNRPGAILVRTAKRRLVWRKGGRYRSGNDTPYAPAELHVIAFTYGIVRMSDFMSKTVVKGGRLSRGRVEEALHMIRVLMMLPALSMDHIDLKGTFVVEEAGHGQGKNVEG